jgi:hypothetical protein
LIARRLISFLFNLATPLVLFAANPVTWNVNISTTGQDVFWTSPTALTLGLPEYEYSYEITKLTANVSLLGDRNLLGFLDETSGSGTTTAFPFTLVEEMLEEPTTGSSADIRIEVDNAGIGRASGTNIELGSVLGLPIRRVDLMATVSILGVLSGDYNRDGIVDAADYGVWREDFGRTTDLAADGNRNNSVDAADYVVWRNNLQSDNRSGLSAATSVPEPPGWLILATGLAGLLFPLTVLRDK